LEGIFSKLHPVARKRILRFLSVERRNQGILGRALLAVALTELGALPGVLSELGVRPTGAPDLPTGYSGSISHTDGLVGAVAATGTVLGFDLEHRWHSFPEPGPRSFEACQGSLRDRSLRSWVSSEALAKASGAPLSDILASGRMDLSESWTIRTFEVDDGLAVGIATLRPIPRPLIVWLEKDQILERIHQVQPG
jgi:phosphopantetheinyl transferase